MIGGLLPADDSEAPAKSVFLMGYSVGPLTGVLEKLLEARTVSDFLFLNFQLMRSFFMFSYFSACLSILLRLCVYTLNGSFI